MQKSRSIGISTSKGLYICKSKSWRLESHYIVNTSPFLSVSLSLRARIECHKPTNCERHYCDDYPENGRHNQIEETYTCWSDQNYSHLMNMTMITKVQWSDHHERWWFIWLHLNGCNTTNTENKPQRVRETLVVSPNHKMRGMRAYNDHDQGGDDNEVLVIDGQTILVTFQPHVI